MVSFQSAHSDDRLQRLVSQIEELPPAPDVLVHLLDRLSENSTAGADQLEEVILQDPSLTARILAMANSSYYGYSRQLSSVSQAVVVLGARQVKSLAMAVFVANTLGSGKGPLDTRGLWSHSVALSHAAKRIAKQTAHVDEDAAQVAGLLHDLGKLVFNSHFAEEYSQCLRTARAEQVSLAEVERRVFGANHSTVGGWVAERWNLPREIVEAISMHHTPGEAKHAPGLVYTVHLSDALVRGAEIGDNGSPVAPKIAAKTLAVLQIPVSMVRETHQNLIEERENLIALSGQLRS